MKKLLKSEICGSVNSTRCAVIGPKNLKSQSLRLLFIEQYMNSSRNTQNAPKRVEKKKADKTQTQFFSAESKRSLRGVCLIRKFVSNCVQLL